SRACSPPPAGRATTGTPTTRTRRRFTSWAWPTGSSAAPSGCTRCPGRRGGGRATGWRCSLVTATEGPGGRRGRAPAPRPAAAAARRGGREMEAYIQPDNVMFFEWLGWRRVGGLVDYAGIPHQRMLIGLVTPPDAACAPQAAPGS